ncbi:prolyl aminopeptidase [Taklimakanibacter lacteus]|uniref:prolyl aminopeptidase n=1 Tax=Taklimakanibacter lacteus TaxID=2268456 RepID=UPI000E6734BF
MTVARPLYPEIEPYRTGRLRVSALHEIYYEECGSPAGKPVVVLHGGPGGGIAPFLRRFHNPQAHRIILFDQRGCGRSTPFGELRENTTWDLVQDMERLRDHCGVERWQVLGGSWGSTLALAYAETHPERVSELILRSVFLLRQAELHWFYQEGASWIFPDAWEAYLAPIPEMEQNDMIAAYHKRLTGGDNEALMTCARAWSVWESTCLSLLPNPERVTQAADDRFAFAFARIENHYFTHRGFFQQDGQLLLAAHRLKDIPGVIVQGRYDVVTPMHSAWALHKVWPSARLDIVDDAGHTGTEPGLAAALVNATDRFI